MISSKPIRTEQAVSDSKKFYQESFRSTPSSVVQAPGRLELLGNHTDYNEGLVMSVAVDRHIYIAAAPRNDGKVELVSSAFPGHEEFYCNRIEKNSSAPWADYVKGVLLQLRRRGVHFTGFNAAIHGTVPPGAGMSSSAALEVATALTVRNLFPFALTENGLAPAPVRGRDGKLPSPSNSEKLVLAKLCQGAEHEFVGVRSGLLDQISSLFGKASQIIQIDFRHTMIDHDPMPPGVAIVVCESDVKHALTGGEYNELRAQCESAAHKLGVPALRSVDMKMLEANRGRLTQREYECAFHIVGENQRVAAGERALRDGDIVQFGQYLFQSHASSRDYFKNSIPELDILVELAQQHPACLGARLTGGGFGGATINLVRAEGVADFSRHMAAAYKARTDISLEPIVCQIVDGAR